MTPIMTRTTSSTNAQCQDLSMDQWVGIIEKAVANEFFKTNNDDGSHDLGHFHRVSSLARRFAREEKADELVAFTAGMLHDIVTLPKNDPNSNKSSYYAAVRSEEILNVLNFPKDLIPNVSHAVHAHSFSANIQPKTVEARCVQDADRMEALGAFGLMRVFYCSGIFGSQLMDENDPAVEHRELNDKKFALDHFVTKLLTLHGTMKTDAGKITALSLTRYLEDYRNTLIDELKSGNVSSGRLTIASTCQDAGQKRLPLFNADDPFAENGRTPDKQRFALDGLLVTQDPYIQVFMDQLRFELNGYEG